MTRVLATISLFSFGLILAPTLVAQTTLVNHLTMNQWVQSTSDGSLQGRIVLPATAGQVETLKDVNVAILGRDGEVLRATSNDDGEFTIPDVAPGVYALTARGDNVFACCAMHVIPTDYSDQPEFPAVAEVSLANVDYTTVNTAVIRYMPPKAKTAISFSDAKLGMLANRVCGQDLFRVAQSEGGMKGQIHLAGTELNGADLTNVFIFKDGVEVERTLTDEGGRFAVEKLPAGQYSLLAVGAGGLGLIGFELVDLESQPTNNAALTTTDSEERLVALQSYGHCCQEFGMQIAPMPEIVGCFEEVIVETIVDEGCICEPGCTGCECCQVEFIDEFVVDECCAPIPGGGVTAGAGGGGGGGYGGGGDLGGIAALAAIAAVAASNDNSTSVPASPAIPSN